MDPSRSRDAIRTLLMNTRAYLLSLALLGGGVAVDTQAQEHAHAMPMTAAGTQVAAPKLQAAMRQLWQGHVTHTREYAMAVHDGDQAKATAAADAVLANAKQLAGAVGGFYGKAAGDQMLTLLGGHWAGVKALTDAVYAGDRAAQNKAMADLTNNGHEIAKFLAGANPNLPESTVFNLLAAHVGHHSSQIQQIMAGDTRGEQATWTAMQRHMDVLADALAGGIAKQFPDKAS
jgi:hypothetical protein